MHIGSPARPVKPIGDKVKIGTVLAKKLQWKNISRKSFTVLEKF